MKRWILLPILFALIASSSPVLGAGLIIIDDPQWRPMPHPHPVPPPWPPPQPHLFAPLDVDYVKVHARINDQVAVTAVDQEFYNPNPTRLEGTFVFPVPKGAHVDKFTMEIDGRPVEAELLAADKARHIYEEIVRKLRDPALLEYAGRDVFKVRIFPIEPNSRKRISLSYTELLKSDDGLVNYVLPLNTEKFSAKPIKSLSIKIDLDSKHTLGSLYSPTHTVEIKRESADRAVVGYEASDVQPQSDFALYFAPSKKELGVNLLAHRRAGEDGYFLLLASPGVDVKEQQIIPKDVVFVLDTSGSMAGKKLDQAKKALNFCVENLNDNDHFELIRFSTEVEPLFDKLTVATRANRARAEDFVRDLRAIGGTDIDDALKKALALRPSRVEGANARSLHERGVEDADRPFVVVFLTDGQPTVGNTDESGILADVKKACGNRARIFCFGIGTDVNTHLLDRITEETRAFSQYVLPEEDLEVKVSSFFSKIKEPVLTDPNLKFTGSVRTSQLYPSPLPDLFKGEQLVLAGRYSGNGASAVVVEGTVNGAAKKFAYDVSLPEESSDNDFIPRLWATRRVGYLLDEIRLHGENGELRDEVTDLARRYGIVTPYTAYLIMEDESHREVPVTLRSMQGLERDGAARHEAAQSWQDFKSSSVGDAAVANAAAGLAFRSANAPTQAADEGRASFMRRYGLMPPAGQAAATPPTAVQATGARLVRYSEQSRFVAGKTFFRNDQKWIDSALQKKADAPRVRIEFGSQEYFDLLAKQPRVGQWLALGANVQFLLDGTIYEITSGE